MEFYLEKFITKKVYYKSLIEKDILVKKECIFLENILKNLIVNPVNGYEIMDYICFILSLQKKDL